MSRPGAIFRRGLLASTGIAAVAQSAIGQGNQGQGNQGQGLGNQGSPSGGEDQGPVPKQPSEHGSHSSNPTVRRPGPGNPFTQPLGEPLPHAEQVPAARGNSGGNGNGGSKGNGSAPGPAQPSSPAPGKGAQAPLPGSGLAMAAATAAVGSGLPAAGVAGRRLLTAAATALGTAALIGAAAAQTAPLPPARSGNGVDGSAPAGANTALILYDVTGPWGFLGELYAIMSANLASQFGPWTAKPVAAYAAGEMNSYKAVLYVGSTYDEPLPAAFLTDVLAGTKRVLWCYHNIWQLTALAPDFATRYGWTWRAYDTATVTEVRYKGQSLLRNALNGGGIMDYVSTGSATVLAQAVRSDGTAFPWALRSANLTYCGELPLAYISEGDRYLAFCDLLFDLLDPGRPERHRGLLRIEDLNPTSDPTALRAVADYLSARGVPFGFTLFPRYTDPLGVFNNGRPITSNLSGAPAAATLAALKYLQSKGGVVSSHGYTHQFSNVANPYNAVSGDDFEFYRVVENADHTLTFQGPLPGDSQTAAQGRWNNAIQGLQQAGFARPGICTFPHYSGSGPDYLAAAATFPKRWERSLYFRGLFAGGALDYTRVAGQQYPFPVFDVYRSKVLPENIGCIEPEPFFQFPVQLPADLIGHAKRSLVVRDGFASFYFHPFWSIDYLKQTLEGIQALGYQFVNPATV